MPASNNTTKSRSSSTIKQKKSTKRAHKGAPSADSAVARAPERYQEALSWRDERNEVPRLTEARAKKLTRALLLSHDDDAAVMDLIELVTGIAYDLDDVERDCLACAATREAITFSPSFSRAMSSFATDAAMRGVPASRPDGVRTAARRPDDLEEPEVGPGQLGATREDNQRNYDYVEQCGERIAEMLESKKTAKVVRRVLERYLVDLDVEPRARAVRAGAYMAVCLTVSRPPFPLPPATSANYCGNIRELLSGDSDRSLAEARRLERDGFLRKERS